MLREENRKCWGMGKVKKELRGECSIGGDNFVVNNYNFTARTANLKIYIFPNKSISI